MASAGLPLAGITVMGTVPTATLGLVVTIALIACLVVQEIAEAAPIAPLNAWGHRLNFAIVPLLLLFAVMVVAHVARVM